MKTKNLFRLGALCLALALISTALLSGTFAKYATAVAGTDTALVAKWSFGATDGATAFGAVAQSIDIFEHAYDMHINTNLTGDPIIAPGVDGSFELDISYLADVDATLELAIAKEGEGAGVPLQFSLEENFPADDVCYSLDELEAKILTAFVADLGATAAADATPGDSIITLKASDVAADAAATEATVTVYWRWPHNVADHNAEGVITKLENAGFAYPWTDAMDTALGMESFTNNRSAYTLNVTMTATQVPPTKAP